MKPSYALSLFIFRRDLRLTDNTALLQAMTCSRTILPLFIFDPRQVTNNPYLSEHGVQFMLESLDDLERQLKARGGKLYYFSGKPEKVIPLILQETHAQAVFFNRDYTPFSAERDHAIEEACNTCSVPVHTAHDTLLYTPGTVMTAQNTPYTVFTPFYRTALTHDVPTPRALRAGSFYTRSCTHAHKRNDKSVLGSPSTHLAVHGGREQAKRYIQKIPYDLYKQELVTLDKAQPSLLAAHLKFGTCSVREVFHHARRNGGIRHPFIRSLIWRDFFTHIAAHHPRVFGHAFRSKYDTIPWKKNKRLFTKWCTGETGFPLIDAGMRQLNTTGFMLNRVRMIVASFLTKDMHYDWRDGERYFAQQLIDYDPSVNNGNWQWAASTGCDAQPYFRVFNPWLQQKKFDPECLYIKQWIPELRTVSPQAIHAHEHKHLKGYCTPCLDHAKEKEISLRLYIHSKRSLS